MVILWIVALVSLVFGILFLFAPEKLVRLTEVLNRVVINTSNDVYKHRLAAGIALLILSFVCFFTICRIMGWCA